MRVINSAPKIGYPLLPLEAITGSSCIQKKKKQDHLFNPLPSGRHRSHTSRLTTCFFPGQFGLITNTIRSHSAPDHSSHSAPDNSPHQYEPWFE